MVHHIRQKSGRLLCALTLSTLPLLANADTRDETATIKANCYMEGEGEGLAGPALEDFVKGCIKALSGLDLGDNSIQVKKGFDQ